MSRCWKAIIFMSYKNIHDFKALPVLYCIQRTRILLNVFKKHKERVLYPPGSSYQHGCSTIETEHSDSYSCIKEFSPVGKNLSSWILMPTDARVYFSLSLSLPLPTFLFLSFPIGSFGFFFPLSFPLKSQEKWYIPLKKMRFERSDSLQRKKQTTNKQRCWIIGS